MSGRRQLLWFTLIHPLVDACSVSVLIAGGMTWGRAMAYNAIAFALQLPLGVALDFMRPEMTARCFWLGTCADSAAAWMALLFVSQLATGPVVSLVYDRTRRIGGGTAFGLNCLGLFAGVGG